MESRWWGLEEAMDLLTTSRRMTMRSSRVSAVVSRWPLDIDSSTTSSRLLQSRFRQPLRTANVQTKPEKKAETKGGDSEARTFQAAECEDLRAKLRNIQDENLKLQAVISDLTQVNKRWQKYNNDRQIYVQKLLNTIQDQQEQLNKMGEQLAFSSSEEGIEPSNSNIRSPHCEQELARVQEVERKLKEKIEVLEFQVKANRDDWEAELNEKKQALKEKADIEEKVNLLMSELQALKQSILQRQRNEKLNLCEFCRIRISTELSQPMRNRLFRTAVHLPCSSQPWREGCSPGCSGSDMGYCNLEVDGQEKTENNETDVIRRDPSSDFDEEIKSERYVDEFSLNKTLANRDSSDKGSVTNIWNIGQCSEDGQEAGVSYSRASTVPLVSSPLIQVTPSNSNSSVALMSVSSHPEDPVTVGFSTKGANTVTSFVQIPIAKSSSAPESKSSNASRSSRSSVDSFAVHQSAAPVSLISTTEDIMRPRRRDVSSLLVDEGVETLTRQDIICPGCEALFPPEMHFKFLDHFESCQRNL